MEACQRFLQELSHHKFGSITYEALLIAAIICYIRPFSGNEHDKNANADSKIDKEALKDLTNEEHELHEKFFTLRMKAIAHSEWTHHPTRVSRNGIIISRPFSIWKYFPPSHDIAAFSNLVNKVRLKAQYLIANKKKSTA